MGFIDKLLNLDEQRIIMLGGIPGSGKTTLSKQFSNVGYKIVCLDDIRLEIIRRIPGYENKFDSEIDNRLLISNDIEVKSLAQQRISSYLNNGYSIVIDAVHSTEKSRNNTIRWFDNYNIKPIIIYIECPLNLALERNIERANTITDYKSNGEPIYGRYVPDYAIKLKTTTQTLPIKNEKYKDVFLIHLGLEKRNIGDINSKINELKSCSNLHEVLETMHQNGELKKLFPTLDRCWNVDQENKNHNVTLDKHMVKTATYLQKENIELFLSGLLHDVGKYDTKRKYGKVLYKTMKFETNEKVEVKNVKDKKGFIIVSKLDSDGEKSELLTIKHVNVDPYAHYYNHQTIGSIIAKRELLEIGLDEYADKVYEYILYHMELPFQIESRRTIRRLIDKVGKNNIQELIKLREADKKSTNNETYFENVHIPTVKMIEQILKV